MDRKYILHMSGEVQYGDEDKELEQALLKNNSEPDMIELAAAELNECAEHIKIWLEEVK